MFLFDKSVIFIKNLFDFVINIIFNIICTGGNTRIILGSGILGSKVLADLYLPLDSVDPDTVYGKVSRESERRGEEIRGVKRGRDEKIDEDREEEVDVNVEEEVKSGGRKGQGQGQGQGLGDGDFISMPEAEDGE